MIDESGPMSGRDKHGYFLYCIGCGEPLDSVKRVIGLCSDCYKQERERERRLSNRKPRRLPFTFMKRRSNDD